MQATVAADSQVARFRFGNVVVALVVVALVGGLGLWVSSVPPLDGPLVDVHGDQLGAPITPGVPFTYSMTPLLNVGSLPATCLLRRWGLTRRGCDLSASASPATTLDLSLTGTATRASARLGRVSLLPTFSRASGRDDPRRPTLLSPWKFRIVDRGP